jgi:hypothetical protein
MTPTTIKAEQAVKLYATKHHDQPIAFPELVDAVAQESGTPTDDAKMAVFVFMDRGLARFTADFRVVFSKA